MREMAIHARRMVTRSRAPLVGTRSVAQHWWRLEPNIGDVMSPLVVQCALSVQPVWVPGRFGGKLLGTGSVLEALAASDLVVGAGLIADHEIDVPDSARVLSVRGPLSRRNLRNSAIPERYGDPGLLVAELFGLQSSPSRDRPVGVVPHWTDTETLHTASRIVNVRALNVALPWPDFFAELSACSSVLSSSLHGIVFAESLGIPAAWLRPGVALGGRGFKFEDYYLGTDRKPPAPLSLEAGLEWASGNPEPAQIDLTPVKEAHTAARELLESGMLRQSPNT